jgi:hypothetical protein
MRSPGIAGIPGVTTTWGANSNAPSASMFGEMAGAMETTSTANGWDVPGPADAEISCQRDYFSFVD